MQSVYRSWKSFHVFNSNMCFQERIPPSDRKLQGWVVLTPTSFYNNQLLERGARYAIHRLKPEERARGVIAASAGNHALALAYHGQQFDVPVTVVMPNFAPLMKISSCRSYVWNTEGDLSLKCRYGAEVILEGKNTQEARVYGMKLAQERNLKYINGFDHPDVIAGQGTIGLEILDQVSRVLKAFHSI